VNDDPAPAAAAPADGRMRPVKNHSGKATKPMNRGQDRCMAQRSRRTLKTFQGIDFASFSI
jgi:hypothetical protein